LGITPKGQLIVAIGPNYAPLIRQYIHIFLLFINFFNESKNEQVVYGKSTKKNIIKIYFKKKTDATGVELVVFAWEAGPHTVLPRRPWKRFVLF